MGNKASIFDNEEIIKYNLNISADTLDNIDCYVFKIIPKKEYSFKIKRKFKEPLIIVVEIQKPDYVSIKNIVRYGGCF